VALGGGHWHILRRKSPTRVKLWNIDRFLLIWRYRLYPSLLDAIIIVQPETVIAGTDTVSAPISAGSPATSAGQTWLPVKSLSRTRKALACLWQVINDLNLNFEQLYDASV
jgi:hypothetical protein